MKKGCRVELRPAWSSSSSVGLVAKAAGDMPSEFAPLEAAEAERAYGFLKNAGP